MSVGTFTWEIHWFEKVDANVLSKKYPLCPDWAGQARGGMQNARLLHGGDVRYIGAHNAVLFHLKEPQHMNDKETQCTHWIKCTMTFASKSTSPLHTVPGNNPSYSLGEAYASSHPYTPVGCWPAGWREYTSGTRLACSADSEGTGCWVNGTSWPAGPRTHHVTA